VVICLERGADLHMAQLMPLPLTVSCSNKIQTGFTFLVPAYPGSPGQRAVKRVFVCVWLRHVTLPSSLVSSNMQHAATRRRNTARHLGSFYAHFVAEGVSNYVTLFTYIEQELGYR